MRRLELHRHRDVSGVSGTGVVAEGVQFGDGTVAIRWHGDSPSTVLWASIEAAMAVHGHGGATTLVWLDSGCDRDTYPRGYLDGFRAGRNPLEPPKPQPLTSVDDLAQHLGYGELE